MNLGVPCVRPLLKKNLPKFGSKVAPSLSGYKEGAKNPKKE